MQHYNLNALYFLDVSLFSTTLIIKWFESVLLQKATIVSHVPGVGSSVHVEADDELYWQVTFVECQSYPWTYGRCLTLLVSSSGPTWPWSHTTRLVHLFTGIAAHRQLTFCLMLVVFELSMLLTKPIKHTRAKGPNSKKTCTQKAVN